MEVLALLSNKGTRKRQLIEIDRDAQPARLSEARSIEQQAVGNVHHGVGLRGERGTGQGEFNTPHTIAADAKGNIYVGDRANRRIQVFDPDGTFLREIKIDVPIPPGAKPATGNVSSACNRDRLGRAVIVT